MSTSLYDTSSYLQIDQKRVYEFGHVINQENIINIIQTLESSLVHVPQEKIENITKVMIEILQNILSYAFDAKELENKKRESQATFIIIVDRNSNRYMIKSSNLIKSSQQKIIQQKINEVDGLSELELRTKIKEKMRSKRDLHSRGAGLGFLTIALRVTQSIQTEFLPFKDDISEFILTLYL